MYLNNFVAGSLRSAAAKPVLTENRNGAGVGARVGVAPNLLLLVVSCWLDVVWVWVLVTVMFVGLGV